MFLTRGLWGFDLGIGLAAGLFLGLAGAGFLVDWSVRRSGGLGGALTGSKDLGGTLTGTGLTRLRDGRVGFGVTTCWWLPKS